jgi:hypothetical protein
MSNKAPIACDFARTLEVIGWVDDRSDKAAVRGKSTTFNRRLRYNDEFPRPVDMGDGRLWYWMHDLVAWMERRPYTDEPKRAAELPRHWRGTARCTDDQPSAA